MNGPAILASIIIPAHGHASMTDHCVTSVLASIAPRSDVEIIVVVDDCQPLYGSLSPWTRSAR